MGVRAHVMTRVYTCFTLKVEPAMERSDAEKLFAGNILIIPITQPGH